MSLCFTKGLCCPIGGAILGTKEHIKRLKSIRKSLGGGLMHNAILSNGIEYALDHLMPQIKKDNEMAKALAAGLSQIPGLVASVEKTQTNLVYWTVSLENFDHMTKHGFRIKAFD
jgi:threonine aldolase